MNVALLIVPTIVDNTASTDYQDVLVGKILLDAKRFFQPEDFPQTTYVTIGRTISK